MNFLNKLILVLLTFCVFGCNSVPEVNKNDSVRGYYDDGKNGRIEAHFVLLRAESKPNSQGIYDNALYGKAGALSKGNFYWEKLDNGDSNNPPHFKENKLWVIE